MKRERNIAKARKETEVWEVLPVGNREKKKRKRVNMEIEMGELKEHFMELLGRVEERVVRRGEGRESVEERYQ